MTAGSSALQTDDRNSQVGELVIKCLVARCRRNAEVLNEAEAALRQEASKPEYGYYLLAAARREPAWTSVASAMELIQEAGSYLPTSLQTLIEQLITAGHVHLTEGHAPTAMDCHLRAYVLLHVLGFRAPHHLWRETIEGTLSSLRAMESIEAH
jgi:hypothetical protein